MTDLENDVLNIIEAATGQQYVGKLTCGYDPVDETYMAAIYFNREYTPTVLGYQGTEEEFKQYLCEEMKKRRLHEIPY